MKNRIRFLFVSVTIVIMSFASKAYSQNAVHKLSFYIGYGVGNPDKRYEFLYDKFPLGPVQTVINKSGRATLDDEYNVGINYKYLLTPKINIGLGIGYAKLVQDFLLPANEKYFKQSIYPFFWRDTSQYHLIQMQPSFDVKLLSRPAIFGVNFMGVSNISFRKHINLFNLYRNKTENFSSELYTGIYGEFKSFRLDIGYRIFHWKYRDDAIANNGLRVDTYNPSKWRFQLSYEFWRSKKKE